MGILFYTTLNFSPEIPNSIHLTNPTITGLILNAITEPYLPARARQQGIELGDRSESAKILGREGTTSVTKNRPKSSFDPLK